jgi:hypothetical protein
VLDPEVQEGYVLHFHPGPPPHEERDPARYSPSSLASFALVEVPAESGAGVRRTFCADSTGRLCVIDSAEDPALADGVCPLLCTDLHLGAPGPSS